MAKLLRRACLEATADAERCPACSRPPVPLADSLERFLERQENLAEVIGAIWS